MKKLYSTLTALCAVAVASASITNANQVKATLTASSDVTPVLVRSGHADAQVAKLGESTPKAKVLARAHEADQWEALGNATFYEGLVLPTYGVETALQMTTPVEKSKTTEGLYRVANPYKALADANPNVFSYDATAAEPIYLQVVANDKFYIESFNTGLIDLADNAAVSLTSQAQGLIEGNGLDLCLQVVPEAFGEFQNGVFKYTDPTFVLNGNTYYDNLLVIAGHNYSCNKFGGFKVVLPGAVEKDYSISVSHLSCADGNKFTFDFTLGADVENFKTFLADGEYNLTAGNISVVAENGQAWTKNDTSISADFSDSADGIVTIFAVVVDADNKPLGSTRGLFYVVNDNADQWVPLEGKALYTDDIVASIYQNHDDEEREVAIEENKTTPGYYRLVNPYADPYKFAAQSVHTGEHNHYIYINASDPEKVYIEESPIGWELGDGAMAVISDAFMQLSNGVDPGEITTYGTLKDQTITFPQKTLAARELNYNNGGWYSANINNAFKVVVPKKDAVGDIIADNDANAPVEFFNLQGQRVDNPAAGQLLIKRQGNTVTKVLVK